MNGVSAVLSKKKLESVKFRNPKLTVNSRETYLSVIKTFFAFCAANKLSIAFDIDVIQHWLNESRTAATYNIRMSVLREYYYKRFEKSSDVNRLKIREAFESLRYMKPDLAKRKEAHYFTKAEVDRFIEKFTPRLGCIVSALFWTGCRISELLNIRLTDITLGDPVSIRILGKGRKERVVYLPLDEYRKIVAVYAGQKWLFETVRHTQIVRTRVQMYLRRQGLKKFGLKKIHAHLFRHSKAMYLKELGLTPDEIARALGHADVSVTLSHYMHGTPGAKEQGIPRSKNRRAALEELKTASAVSITSTERPEISTETHFNGLDRGRTAGKPINGLKMAKREGKC